MKKVIGIHKFCINNSIRTDSEKNSIQKLCGVCLPDKGFQIFFFEKVIRNFKRSLPCITSGM